MNKLIEQFNKAKALHAKYTKKSAAKALRKVRVGRFMKARKEERYDDTYSSKEDLRRDFNEDNYRDQA